MTMGCPFKKRRGEMYTLFQKIEGQKGNDRKLRLYAVALARKVQHLEEKAKILIDMSEKLADGLIEFEELEKECFAIYTGGGREMLDTVGFFTASCAKDTAWSTSYVLGNFYKIDPQWMFNVFNSIFLPKKPVILPAFTPDMKNLASYMYQNNDFTDFPVLRDMFLDVGTTDKQVLQHLKSPLHFRGDWLIDIILGK